MIFFARPKVPTLEATGRLPPYGRFLWEDVLASDLDPEGSQSSHSHRHIMNNTFADLLATCVLDTHNLIDRLIG